MLRKPTHSFINAQPDPYPSNETESMPILDPKKKHVVASRCSVKTGEISNVDIFDWTIQGDSG